MRAVVQRVSAASVRVDGEVIAEIGTGLLALVGVTHTDDRASAAALGRKIAGLRILAGERSVGDEPASSVLVVSQFTLYGDARKGRRPTWVAAAPGAVAEPLIETVRDTLQDLGVHVESGRFGADMAVELVNEGPMTVLLEI